MTSWLRSTRQCAWLIAALAIASASAFAQETRGSIAGRVSDTGGAVLPGVTVTVTNSETNVSSVIVTNDAGLYNALFLQPGTYSVTAELSGFRKYVNSAVGVRVSDKVVLDVTLEPGAITEEVKVVAERPPLETGSATMGQVIDSKLIGEMPLGDGTSYGLTRLAGGGTFERSYALQRPMDNDNLRGFAVAGTMNSEFTIDGSSNSSRRRAPAFSRRPMRCRSSRWRPPSTTRRLGTPAPATSTSRSRAAPTSCTARDRISIATIHDPRTCSRRTRAAAA
jgi:hypothetical protein